jgi:glycosyltransferase involved in cell wall biosynthesis
MPRFNPHVAIESPDALVPAPVVSVCLIAYNQSPYIGQSVRSILDQTLDVPFEVVVGDDGSDDGTWEILQGLQAASPDRVRLLRTTRRIGKAEDSARLNLLRNLHACRGTHVALLEGDDFWCVPGKLQAQWDALRSDPAASLCSHLTENIDQDGNHLQIFGAAGRATLDDYLFPYRMHTSSLFFRNFELPRSCVRDMFDLVLVGLMLQRGHAVILDQAMSVRRQTTSGIWAGLPARQRTDLVPKRATTLLRYFGRSSDGVRRFYLNAHLKRLKEAASLGGLLRVAAPVYFTYLRRTGKSPGKPFWDAFRAARLRLRQSPGSRP